MSSTHQAVNVFFPALQIIHRCVSTCDFSRQHNHVMDTLQLRGKNVTNQCLSNRTLPNCRTPLRNIAGHFLTHFYQASSQVGLLVPNNLYNTTLRSLQRSCTPCFTSCKSTYFKAVVFPYHKVHKTP